jgi:hypothetical protein
MIRRIFVLFVLLGGINAISNYAEAALPDLKVTTMKASKAAEVGGKIKITVKVKNQGSDTAGESRVTIYLSTDKAIAKSDISTKRGCNIPSLLKGKQHKCSGYISIPTTIKPGQYYIGAYVDDNEEINESNESNNGKSASNKTVITVAAAPGGRPLNDTGITTCSDSSSTDLSCPVTGYPGQDAEYGRDVSHNDDSDGHAGFSFTKLDANGKSLPATVTNWSCVKDNVTGLIWEVKTDDGGLQDMSNTYSWYDPDSSVNGGSDGFQGGGSCAGNISCDTYSFVQAVNAQGLCGYKDWRMPIVDELSGIADLSGKDPSIDTSFFPNTPASNFWSGSPMAGYSYYAWGVHFYNGGDYWNSRYDGALAVRLVRGGQ